MKLHLLREHYTKKPGNKWVPKRAFETVQQIKNELGSDDCNIYKCTICSALHTGRLSEGKT